MSSRSSGWNVIDSEGAVLTYSYEFSKGGRATTFAARMGNGSLLVVSPCIRLTDALVNELSQYGEVGAIIANNGFHYLGLNEWINRFPDARVFAPTESIDRISKKVPEVSTLEPLSALTAMTGDRIGFREVPDTKIGESWYWVRIENGYVWFVSDILINLPTLPSAPIPRLLFKLSGSAPGLRVFSLMLKFSVRDKRKTLSLLQVDMANHSPTVIVPAHGTILFGDEAQSDVVSVIQKNL